MKKFVICLVVIVVIFAGFFGVKKAYDTSKLGQVEGYVCKVDSQEKVVYICFDEAETSESFEMIMGMDSFVIEDGTKLVNFNSIDELEIGDYIAVEYAGSILEVEPAIIEDVKTVTLQ